MHLEEVHQLVEGIGEKGVVTTSGEERSVMGALTTIFADGAIIGVMAMNIGMAAVIHLADIKDSVTIVLGIVTMVCTICMTVHNIRSGKKGKK